jgi:hypothetical protein
MYHVGDFVPGRTVRGYWPSNGADGASITRATNGTISVYKDGNTTQSTTGVTDTEDFDSLTGVHLVAIDTSADATFYSSGSDFAVVLSAATIDGKTVNTPLFSFSLKNRYQAGVIASGTAAAGAAGSLTLAATSLADDVINGGTLMIVAGTGVGQARTITDWVDSTNVATVSPNWTVTPDNTSVYDLFAGPPATTTNLPDVNVASMSANVMNASALASDAVTEIQSGLATAATQATIAAYIDTEVAAILAAVDTEVAAIKAKTDNLPAAPAAVGDIPTATQNADALLKRDMSAVTGESARSMLNALRLLRNKFTVSGGTLTVCKEDDSTTAWTAAVTGTSGADPITAVDPA